MLLKPGSSILIGSATGGVGTAVALLVHALELDVNLIGSCSPSIFDYVRTLGVVPVNRFDPNLWKTVRNLTKTGEGVDVAFDAVGTTQSLEQSHKASKDDIGQVVMIGRMGYIAADGSSMAVDVSVEDLAKHLHLPRMTLWSGERDYYQKTRMIWMRDFMALLEKVRAGKLNPRVAKLSRLSDAVRANESLVSGVDVLGKMMFIVDAKLAKILEA